MCKLAMIITLVLAAWWPDEIYAERGVVAAEVSKQ